MCKAKPFGVRDGVNHLDICYENKHDEIIEGCPAIKGFF